MADSWREAVTALGAGQPLVLQERLSLLEKGLAFVKADGTLALTIAGRAWTDQGRPVVVRKHPDGWWHLSIHKDAVRLLGRRVEGTQRDRPYESAGRDSSHARTLAHAAYIADCLGARGES